MCLLSGMNAMRKMVKIKAGGKEKLSIADITAFIINLQDGERNLSDQQFKAIYALYKALRKCHTKMEMDLNGYYEQAAIIIGIFNQVAPYEKYSGMEKTEALFFMEDIEPLLLLSKPRSESLLNSIRLSNPELNKYFSEEEMDIEVYLIELANKYKDKDWDDYIAQLMEKGSLIIRREHATMFVGILIAYKLYGKSKALELTDKLFRKWINEEKGLHLQFRINFLSGALSGLKIMTREELDQFIDVYRDLILHSQESPADLSVRLRDM